MVGCSNPYVADKMDAKECKTICAPVRSLMVIRITFHSCHHMLVLSGINKSKLLIVNQRIRTSSMLPSDVLHVPFPVIHHPGIQSKTYRLYDGNGNGTELPNTGKLSCAHSRNYMF